MALSRFTLLSIALGLWITPAFAQTRPPRCLHGEMETQVQAQRRGEALDAADLINRVLDRQPPDMPYPTWEELAKSPFIASLRGMASKRAELARKMGWGTEQPLPGWQIHYAAAQNSYAFSLTDMRDPCQFTFSSNDTGVVIEGLPADRRGQVRVVPLDSSQ